MALFCKAGELLYCKNQAQTVCCSNNYTCVENWLAISDAFINTAADYLTDQVTAFIQLQSILQTR